MDLACAGVPGWKYSGFGNPLPSSAPVEHWSGTARAWHGEEEDEQDAVDLAEQDHRGWPRMRRTPGQGSHPVGFAIGIPSDKECN